MVNFRASLLVWVAAGVAPAASATVTHESPPETYARYVIAAESYGQAIWYSARASFRFHRLAMVNSGYSYISVPPGSSGGATAAYHLMPVSISAMWPMGSGDMPVFAELLFGGNFNIGSDRTARTGVRATATGQTFTPVVGFGFAYFPDQGGVVMRAMCYIYQGIDSVGIESRRLPWLGGSIGYAF